MRTGQFFITEFGYVVSFFKYQIILGSLVLCVIEFRLVVSILRWAFFVFLITVEFRSAVDKNPTPQGKRHPHLPLINPSLLLTPPFDIFRRSISTTAPLLPTRRASRPRTTPPTPTTTTTKKTPGRCPTSTMKPI